MASKSKQQRQRAANRKESAFLAVVIAIMASFLALIQNKYGQFSDIRGFYGMHFADGQHHWPFSTHTLLGAAESIHPVEYPALTGLVMWLLSFFIEPAQYAWVDYFRLTATFHIALFAITVFFIKKLAGAKWAIIFALSLPVLYSLNRNWDIWAIATMIWAIYLFEKGKTKQSAIWLAVSIATKFFPLVLLFPIAIYYFRKKELKQFFIYFAYTVGAWILINLPFALINFRGWSYFYEFSFDRAIGSASVWEVASKIGTPIPTTDAMFYALNLGIFALLGIYLLKSKLPVPLIESSFLTLFAFILFNKQYSMQYIIWLSALAVIAISRLSQKKQVTMIYAYVVWQIADLAFQYGFFQGILTSTYAGTATPASPEITGMTFGVIGVIRYIVAVGFAFLLAKFLYDEKRAITPTK
jgi:uncharacterized membrane protein